MLSARLSARLGSRKLACCIQKKLNIENGKKEEEETKELKVEGQILFLVPLD